MLKFGFSAAALLALAFAPVAYALDVTVNAAATVVTPLAATSGTALSFGEIAASGSGGTVDIDASTGARNAAGGASLVTGGTVSRGAVSITAGQASRAVLISFPNASETLTRSGGGTMTADTFTTDQASNTITLNGSGTGSFNVGGTLNVGASQTAGSYTGTVTVRLLYQ